MDEQSKNVIPFLLHVLNDMYENIKNIRKSMDQMNKVIDNFLKNFTDNLVTISTDLTGIIQIVRASRETIFTKVNESINNFRNEFINCKASMGEIAESSGNLAIILEKAKNDLQNKMQDAEFLALILEMKEVLNEINKEL